MPTPRQHNVGSIARARREVQRIKRGLGARLIQAGRVRPAGYDVARPPHTEVAAFFPDEPAKAYQLVQWLPVLTELNRTRSVTIVVRHAATFELLRQATELPVLLSPTFEDLMALYERARYRAIVYVNNGLANFQSLAFQPAAHIHVNHGESDKLCMVSNQAKAYDRVFVAGQAAVARHQEALAWFDSSRLVLVGRPQLDLTPATTLAGHDGPTVVYAPTWEGEDDANNYTSIDLFGPAIAAAALSVPAARFLYKPHPRIADSFDPGVRAGHHAVLAAISAAARRTPGSGHQVVLDGDVLALLPGADLVITDVSSVGLDFLYLHPERPLVVTDRRNNRSLLHAQSPMTTAVHVLDESTLADLATDLPVLLSHDAQADVRRQMREHYFGSRPHGGSLERFVEAIGEVISEHEQALAELRRQR